MRYKLVMFDFDGTLANSMPWFVELVNELADRFGFKRVKEREHEMLRGFNPRQVSEHLDIPFWKVPVIGAYLKHRMGQEIHKISLYPGIPEVVRSLSDAGITLAVVSSNAEENVRAVMGPEIAELFADYECGVSVFGKPPKLRKVLRHCDAEPEDAIYIGDEVRDVEAAEAVGLDFGAVSWGYNNARAFEAYAPTFVFDRVEEIEAVLLGEGASRR